MERKKERIAEVKKFKKIILTIILVSLSFIMTGCGGKEPNEIVYVVALGIDKSENEGNYNITIQYANPTQISGGGGEEGGKAGSEIMESLVIESPNIYSAIGLANHIVSKTFSLSHTKIMVFSEEIAKEGLKDIMETFARNEEIRPDIYFAVSLEGANKYLSSVNPIMEVNPAKYYQLIFEKNNVVGIPQAIAKNIYFGIETDDYDSVIPIVGVAGAEDTEGGGESSGGSEGESGGSSSGGNSSNGGSEQEEPQENTKQPEAPLNKNTGFEYKMKNYIGGEAAIKMKNRSEAIGSVIFKGDKMIGTMGSIETEMYKLLTGDYKYSYLSLYNEKTPDNPVTVRAVQECKPDYDIDIDNKEIDIELFLDADIFSLPADYNIEQDIINFEKNSEKYISEACGEFMKDFLQKYESDAFHLKERVKSKFLTNEKYNEYKENMNLSDFDINVKTKFKIRRTGLVIRED